MRARMELWNVCRDGTGVCPPAEGLGVERGLGNGVDKAVRCVQSGIIGCGAVVV